MSSLEDNVVSMTLAFLAQMRDEVASFVQHVREQAERGAAISTNVISDVECRQYRSGLTVEIWVEVQTEADRSLTWWMDIVRVNERWRLDASVSWNGQERVIQLPEQELPDFGAVRQQAPLLLRQLFSAGEEVLGSFSKR
jgi:hypothetical protein